MTTPAAPTAEPAAAHRYHWLDLARGLAVVSMIIAHTSPWGGVLNVTEFLSAPWFAFILGASLWLASRQVTTGRGRFVLVLLLRGAVLVVLGVALQAIYSQIDVVLQTLGLLMIVLAPLARLLDRWWIAAGIAGIMAVVSPLLKDATRGWLAGGGSGSELIDQTVRLLAAGTHYRVTSMIVFAAAGMAAAHFLVRFSAGIARPSADRSALATGRVRAFAKPSVRALTWAIVFVLSAGVVYLLGRLTPAGASPYSGTTAELVGATLLSLSATWCCIWLEIVLRPRFTAWFTPFEATGRMALTAYALQIVALAVITRTLIPGQRDDHWWVMLGVIALCVGFSAVYLTRFRQGPLERLARLPDALMGRG